MRGLPVLCLAALVAGCSLADDEPEQSDAAAVAAVERLSTPPLIPIDPQPITFKDIEEKNLFGAGCAVVVHGVADPSFLAQEEKGWLKLDNTIVELTPDRSSDQLPYQTWSKYVGLENWLTLERDSAGEKQTGEETTSAPGEIVVHDFADRVVYRAAAEIVCGA